MYQSNNIFEIAHNNFDLYPFPRLNTTRICKFLSYNPVLHIRQHMYLVVGLLCLHNQL